MAIPHAMPGQIVDVRPLGSSLATTTTHTLVKTKRLEVIRLIVTAGKEIPPHHVSGEITVQCLEGKVAFTAQNKTQVLEAGQLLYLAGDQSHALQGIEDSSVLITILLD